MTPDTSGRLFEMPLLTWDPALSCWRTSGAISRSGSTGSSVTLPTSGMTRSGELFEHPTWGAATSGPDCSLLPTPVVNDMGDGKTVEWWDEWTAAKRAQHGNGNGHGNSLAIEMARLLPTPRTSDANGPGEHGTGGPDLRTAVSALTPPPSTGGNNTTDPHPTPPPTGDSTPGSSNG